MSLRGEIGVRRGGRDLNQCAHTPLLQLESIWENRKTSKSRQFERFWMFCVASQASDVNRSVYRRLNFENIKLGIFGVIDWNYAAYYKVRDQEAVGSNPIAPAVLFLTIRRLFQFLDSVQLRDI